MAVKKIKQTGNRRLDFIPILKGLADYANSLGKPEKEILEDFLLDLRHVNDENYEKKLKEFTLKGISKTISNELSQVISKKIKRLEEEEKQQQKNKEKASKQAETEVIWGKIKEELHISTETEIEKLENYKFSILNKEMYPELNEFQRKEIVKKISSVISEKRYQLNKKIEEQKRFDKTWTKLENLVKAEQELNKVTPLEAWILYRSKAEKDESIKLSEERREELVKLIDGKIAEEEDKIYYEQVKYFTNGFKFLESEIASATLGIIRKFSDKKSYERFRKLRSEIKGIINGNLSEKGRLEQLLKQEEISDVDKKILEARINNINLREEQIERV